MAPLDRLRNVEIVWSALLDFPRAFEALESALRLVESAWCESEAERAHGRGQP
jgi:hypothetical protein